MSSAAPRVWHISGANTGLGLNLAVKALQEGDQVVAAVRSPSKVPDVLRGPNVKVLQYDASWSQEAINAYTDSAFSAFSKIDVLVNNAGYAYLGAVEETESVEYTSLSLSFQLLIAHRDAQVQNQFDINVFGVLRTIRSFLPHFRSQKCGTIMNISSIGGLHGYVSNGVYCATKFAIEGITDALAGEIEPFGLKAVVVEPGYFRTEFLKNPASGSNLAPEMAVYEGTPAQKAREAITLYNGRQPGDPKEGAARMWEYVAGEGLFKGKERLLRLPLGSDTGVMMREVGANLAKTAEYYEDIWKSTDFDD